MLSTLERLHEMDRKKNEYLARHRSRRDVLIRRALREGHTKAAVAGAAHCTPSYLVGLAGYGRKDLSTRNREIQFLFVEGVSVPQLSKDFGLNDCTINGIVKPCRKTTTRIEMP